MKIKRFFVTSFLRMTFLFLRVGFIDFKILLKYVLFFAEICNIISTIGRESDFSQLNNVFTAKKRFLVLKY